MTSRATLRLTLECTNACLFCAQQGLEPTDDGRALAERLEALRQRAEEITFVGGEPTIGDALEQAVRLARDAGFRRIGVQSNGSRLCEPAYAGALADAGLTDVHLSIHGPSAAAHDYHTATPGSFERTMRALSVARRLELTSVVTTVATRSSYRVLGDLAHLLRSREVAGWSVLVPRVAGRAREAADRLVPRLSLALPYVLHAVQTARRAGMPAFVQGAPLCLLGPYAGLAPPSPDRAFAEVCEGCALRARCPGVDPAYLARFGAGELTARTGEPPAPAGPAEVARMFVGIGELALPDGSERPLGGRARDPSRLPVVG